MLRAYTYAGYAQAYGWTPAQVDELPAWLVPLLIPVTNLIQEVQHGQ